MCWTVRAAAATSGAAWRCPASALPACSQSQGILRSLLEAPGCRGYRPARPWDELPTFRCGVCSGEGCGASRAVQGRHGASSESSAGPAAAAGSCRCRRRRGCSAAAAATRPRPGAGEQSQSHHEAALGPLRVPGAAGRGTASIDWRGRALGAAGTERRMRLTAVLCPRPCAQAVAATLAGKDVLIILPTGERNLLRRLLWPRDTAPAACPLPCPPLMPCPALARACRRRQVSHLPAGADVSQPDLRGCHPAAGAVQGPGGCWAGSRVLAGAPQRRATLAQRCPSRVHHRRRGGCWQFAGPETTAAWSATRWRFPAPAGQRLPGARHRGGRLVQRDARKRQGAGGGWVLGTWVLLACWRAGGRAGRVLAPRHGARLLPPRLPPHPRPGPSAGDAGAGAGLR